MSGNGPPSTNLSMANSVFQPERLARDLNRQNHQQIHHEHNQKRFTPFRYTKLQITVTVHLAFAEIITITTTIIRTIVIVNVQMKANP
ncbi:hypothetical protein V9T40_009286 [Parthenolecanium corni]|uniref:Uncharacterized protein n=1 Tax=Parthenolecanium corni TaxID=536013 RepID=A0AAN9TMG1_9HEMI